MIELTNLRRLVREYCNQPLNTCIVFIENSKNAPKTIGTGYYFTNKSGDIIHYPSAYSRAWGKPIYNLSTRRIEVGKNWKPKMPKGMTLHNRGGLHFVRNSDRMDFHFSGADYHKYQINFCSWVRKQMAANYKRRVETNKINNLVNKNINTTYVSLLDSRRAGNCVEGSLNYAKKKFNISREDLVHCPWLMQIPAKLLARDRGNDRVMAAIKQAVLRETMVSI